MNHQNNGINKKGGEIGSIVIIMNGNQLQTRFDKGSVAAFFKNRVSLVKTGTG